MATTTTRLRRRVPTAAKKSPKSPATTEFAPGSLESELTAIGRSVPAAEWAKVPVDYFANLDHYLHAPPKKK
jgi:hypothetical protein